jgi:hypothetical protein
MAGLMVSLEFRLLPMASASKVIGHRVVHVAPFSQGEPGPMSPHRRVQRCQPVFEHLVKALEALASKTSDAWLGVNA